MVVRTASLIELWTSNDFAHGGNVIVPCLRGVILTEAGQHFFKQGRMVEPRGDAFEVRRAD